jgi:cell division transport system permease protein
VGIALALPAGLRLLQVNLVEISAGWDGRPGLTVYFEIGARGEAVEAARATLESVPGIATAWVTSADAALAEFRSYTELADALDVLGENPLPASLRATLAADAGIAELEAASRVARGLEAVGEVVVEKTWLERIIDISQVVSRLGLILGALFAVGAVLVTATSVRLAIEARLEELRVLKLIGATDRQIRRPFLYFGAMYGLGGGVVAAMLISLCLVAVEGPLAHLVGSYGSELKMSGFDPIFLGGLLLAGAVLGVAGALLAARQRVAKLEIV